jgi:hypothetical protein
VLCRVVRYPASCCFVYDLMYTFHLMTYAMYGDMPTFLYLSQGLLHSRMCSCHRIVCFVAVHSYMDYVGVVYLPPLLPMDYGAYTHLMVYYYYFSFVLSFFFFFFFFFVKSDCSNAKDRIRVASPYSIFCIRTNRMTYFYIQTMAKETEIIRGRKKQKKKHPFARHYCSEV